MLAKITWGLLKGVPVLLILWLETYRHSLGDPWMKPPEVNDLCLLNSALPVVGVEAEEGEE